MNDFDALTEISPIAITDSDQPVETKLIELAEMLAVGKSTAYIAAALERSPAWVRTHKNDPVVASMRTQIQREALESDKAKIVIGTAEAAETMLSLVKEGPPSIRFAASKDLLDRVGLRAPEKTHTDINVNVNHYTREDRIRNSRERALRLGLNMADVSSE